MNIVHIYVADCVLAAFCASLGLVSPHLRCHSGTRSRNDKFLSFFLRT